MKTIKMRGIAAAVTGALLIGFGTNAMADSTDDILNALIAKGVLTEEEGALLTKGRTGEKEAAAKKKDSAITASFKDGIKWESGDKANSMSVNGRIQMDYRSFGDSNKDTSVPDTFDVRRAYLGAKGVFNKYYEFEVATDFGTADSTSKSKSAQLDVAFINLHYWDQAQFKFGQFKMPFSLEEQTSSRFIDFQERSLVNAYVPGKEIGAMVWGAPFNGVTYGLALSTGEGKNMNEAANKKDSAEFIGRVTANFAEMIGDKDNVYHFGLGYTSGKMNSFNAKSATEGKGLTFLDQTFTTATSDSLDRTRYGIEGALALGPVKLQSEWVRMNLDGTNSTGVKFDNDIDVWYAEALWLITGEKYADSYKGAKFDRIKPKNDFNPDGAGMGAWELGIRYTSLDANDFKKGVTNAGATAALSASEATKVDSTTIGLKWIPMANWRFMANYTKTNFDKDVVLNSKNFGSEEALTVRAQMDF